jgi:hypothetical protein
MKKEKAPAVSGASSSRGSKHGEGYEDILTEQALITIFIINPHEYRSTS